MTPIPFPTPRRILPPAVAYATGLICEHRPDLADGVRAAVLGDAAVTALDVLTLARVEADDEQGYRAIAYLREIVRYGGSDPKSLHGLADLFGLIPRRTPEMRITTDDGEERDGDPTIGDNYYTPEGGHAVCGLPGGPWGPPEVERYPERKSAAEYAAEHGGCMLTTYLDSGWGSAWAFPELKGEREALRRLIPIHAHTVSLDAAARAAWAKAHLDALGVK